MLLDPRTTNQPAFLKSGSLLSTALSLAWILASKFWAARVRRPAGYFLTTRAIKTLFELQNSLLISVATVGSIRAIIWRNNLFLTRSTTLSITHTHTHTHMYTNYPNVPPRTPSTQTQTQTCTLAHWHTGELKSLRGCMSVCKALEQDGAHMLTLITKDLWRIPRVPLPPLFSRLYLPLPFTLTFTLLQPFQTMPIASKINYELKLGQSLPSFVTANFESFGDSVAMVIVLSQPQNSSHPPP